MLSSSVKDLMYVQRLWGHKRFTSTLQYVSYEKMIYGEEEHNEFVTSVKGARALIEAGFEKADEIDGIHIYRKHK